MPLISDDAVKTAATNLSAPVRSRGFKPEALHTYKNPDGSPIYYRLRMRHPETREKWIRPMSLKNDAFVLKEPEFPDGKPLYGLDLLAQQPGDPVVICEGECCADDLRKHGVVAVTSGGAKSAEATDWRPLIGRKVLIWPDHDEAGFSYGNNVAGILRELDCQIQAIDTVALAMGEKEDAVDWLRRNPDVTSADVFSLPVIMQTSETGLTALAMQPMEIAPVTVSNVETIEFNHDGGQFCLSREGLYYFRDGSATRRLCSWMRVEAATRDENNS